jgi:diguanylate cyclase (GGDEF)-like protein
VRDTDVAARLGGEEFALILPGAGPVEAVQSAERARAAIAGITVGGRALTATAGIATCPEDSRNAGRLLELADAALYSGKRAGRDRSERYNGAHATAPIFADRAEAGRGTARSGAAPRRSRPTPQL